MAPFPKDGQQTFGFFPNHCPGEESLPITGYHPHHYSLLRALTKPIHITSVIPRDDRSRSILHRFSNEHCTGVKQRLPTPPIALPLRIVKSRVLWSFYRVNFTHSVRLMVIQGYTYNPLLTPCNDNLIILVIERSIVMTVLQRSWKVSGENTPFKSDPTITACEQVECWAYLPFLPSAESPKVSGIKAIL